MHREQIRTIEFRSILDRAVIIASAIVLGQVQSYAALANPVAISVASVPTMNQKKVTETNADGQTVTYTEEKVPIARALCSSKPVRLAVLPRVDQIDLPLSGKPMLVHFYADWSKPCKNMKQHIKKVTKKFSSKVDIVEINVDSPASMRLMAKYNVSQIPETVFLNENGKVVTYSIGYSPETLNWGIKQITTK